MIRISHKVCFMVHLALSV
uniref:Uncharacterized protein n=1 Tax=Rhizophora mucronata TaxID=61149 RepID=A0A2P2QZD0_RHIMU